jgi:hypothetical protein
MLLIVFGCASTAEAANTTRVLPTGLPHAVKLPREAQRVYLEAAVRTTPNNPCNGHIDVTFNADLSEYSDGRVGMAYPEDGSCRVFIAALDDPDALCLVLAHEVRHLAGYGHSDNPHDLMYGGMMDVGQINVPACRRAARKLSHA